MDITSILEKVDSEMFGIWFLIGAALVFFMQCGFAMVETGIAFATFLPVFLSSTYLPIRGPTIIAPINAVIPPTI